ncbi:hypothetical protein HYR69_03175 [Candidatus Sumerlaeota bacterium]|nr:hypothetical protein [Candidatus Sumerlaeota bacterium]MBI3736197.1 hypothetical protein [Candidatus Sumerlaeota bacterium]
MSRKAFDFSKFEVLIILGIPTLFGIIVVPWLADPYNRGTGMKSCQENLTRIDGAKEQWALDNGKPQGAVPQESELLGVDMAGYMKTMPRCPAGGKYTINPIGQDPTCGSGFPGHSLSDVDKFISERPPDAAPTFGSKRLEFEW